MKKIISKLHGSNIAGRIFHTLDYCLQKELRGCESVLDLGCGPASPLRNCGSVKYSVGVEAFGPYLEETKKKKIHTEYLHKRIEDVDFPAESFDAVVMLEVLEHLPKDTGLAMLKKAEKWARKKIIVSSPNGYIPQKQVDNNDLQKHVSGWPCREMDSFGYTTRGLAGLKLLRQEVKNTTMGDDYMNSIRFVPVPFWFLIACLSQLFVYYLPALGYGVFSVKRLK